MTWKYWIQLGSSQMFGLDDSGQENNVNSDISAILSMKKVDVPRLSAGVNEIITDRKKHEASRVQDNIKHDQMVDICAKTQFETINHFLHTSTNCFQLMS